MSNVDVNIDFTGVHDKFSEQNKKRGRYALANQMLSDMNPYVPKQESFLRNATSISLDGSEIHWNMQYAQKQFRTQFRNYTTPNTGSRWDLKAKGLHGDQWAGVYARGARL